MEGRPKSNAGESPKSRFPGIAFLLKCTLRRNFLGFLRSALAVSAECIGEQDYPTYCVCTLEGSDQFGSIFEPNRIIHVC